MKIFPHYDRSGDCAGYMLGAGFSIFLAFTAGSGVAGAVFALLAVFLFVAALVTTPPDRQR